MSSLQDAYQSMEKIGALQVDPRFDASYSVLTSGDKSFDNWLGFATAGVQES